MSQLDPTDALLAGQAAYYEAAAAQYDAHALPGWESAGRELDAALAAFHADGDILELACGTGNWTAALLRHARTLTAIDRSPSMLEIARKRVGDDPRVRLVQTDVFAWKPDRRYDAVVFAFWISHVPLERFEDFWRLVDDALVPGGRVFFADDAYRTPEELVEGESSSIVERRLANGSAHRIVKVPHTAAGLEERLRRLGWDIAVTQTSGPFYWGAGGRA